MFDSNDATIQHGEPRSSVLSALLFPIYMNDPDHGIRYCKVYHYADDKNITRFDK